MPGRPPDGDRAPCSGDTEAACRFTGGGEALETVEGVRLSTNSDGAAAHVERDVGVAVRHIDLRGRTECGR